MNFSNISLGSKSALHLVLCGVLLAGFAFGIPASALAGLSGGKLPKNPEDPALKAGFVAHKALYDVRLSSTKSGSQIANIEGKMYYEWKPSCDAWVTNHRFNLTYEYADSPSMVITSDFTTYEAFDGKSLNFSSQRKRDGQIFEELRGKAETDQTGKGQAVYTRPRGLSFDLPGGTLFPVAHTLDVLKKIKDGKRFYNTVIFDGSDDEGPVQVNSFIGKAIDVSGNYKSSQDLDVSLLKSPAHHIRLAFFPMKEPQADADYEMDIVFHENGIISQMDVDYDDFSISQKLVAIEEIKGSCDKGGTPSKTGKFKKDEK